MYKYDFDKFGPRYWQDPKYPANKEVFAPSLNDITNFAKKPSPFVLFDVDTVRHCLSKGIQPLRQVGLGGTHDYEKHKTVTLYLAKCKIKTREFHKIGLTLLADPKNRNSKVYSEILRAHQIPAQNSSLPCLYEKFTLWKCTEHEYESYDIFDPATFKGFAGKTEVIHTSDSSVAKIFDQAFAQLTDYLKKHQEELAWLEKILLTGLVKAVYDERFVDAKASLMQHCSGEYFWDVGGERPSCLIQNLNVGMPSKEIILIEKYISTTLVPLIEETWKSLDIEDPIKRFARGKSNYQAWWGRRGGRTDYWSPRYYGWSS